ncbi:hypothetical protein [Micromonospora endophytica]|uniref:Uncharacterized protein n=1 Tax=Micromonospora endophytica TaxID=515350 RepID=A0A2W2D1N5_9ACTN|nr:hypothetical protein [Micromonospora endophytica]PZF94499.1 hypothetical protein C1I93_16485 [Micromonospora endophytica]RIW43904.1 hypothetical protein D3H59_19295 [Micromonospora endophytica]BCJ56918.1 hypothetical protein Jiend_03400 [Micromonospora endophytica]
MWLGADKKEFEAFLDSASVYWRKNLGSTASPRYLVVEVFHQDIRVAMRNLAVANAIRRIVPAQLVVVTGVEAMWHEALWTEFDVTLVERIAAAYGASEVIDLYRLVEGPARAGIPHLPSVQLFGRRLVPGAPISEETLDEFVSATYCRVTKRPRAPENPTTDPRYRHRAALARVISSYYDALLGGGPAVALVTSHVDYDHWGLAVDSARRAGVPVVHTQQTGCLKAYALYPETDTGEHTFRGELTHQLGEFFARRVWPRRAEVRRNAELVAWRSKVNLGRPSWWRGGASASVDITNSAERARLRTHFAARLGFDPARPIVAVFNHAVSDAPGTNHQSFPTLADWFEETARFASSATEVQWLFQDHPSQFRYDSTGFFESVARRHERHRHMVFQTSKELSKNGLWSVVDLGVTVRGSVSNELPAYGIPVIQAGWSEWSECGLSTVVHDPETYWKALDASISALLNGEELISAEQVERARLWLWFYRSATDLFTPQVPHWEVWPADYLLRTVRTAFRHIESDADPLFEAVERMWTRREPVLTRMDLPVTGGDR